MSEATVDELRAVRAFADAPEDALRELAGHTRVIGLQPGDTIVAQGEISLDVHVLLDGRATVTLHDTDPPRTIATFEAGAVVGEIAALTGGPRTATVAASEPGRAARIPADAFASLLEDVPEVGRRLAAIAHERLRHNRLLGYLGQTFPDLAAEAIRAMADGATWTHLDAGEVLFHQGDVADAAHLVISGRLHVLADDERATVIGEVGRGEVVGEQALIEGGARTATIRAARATELASFPRAAFEAFIRRHPRAMIEVARIAITRARHPGLRTGSTEAIITLVPAHDGVDLEGFVDRLLPTLEHHRSVARVSSDRADAHLRRDGIADADRGSPGEVRLLRWLEELEDANEVVLLQTDPEPTAWTRRAVALAEHLVIVADVTRDPQPTGLEAWTADRSNLPNYPRRSLVLLHPEDVVLPRGTRSWLDVRNVDRHHHVRGMAASDVARLGRHLAGAAMGIALSGGGARGYGHLGAVQAMRELGLPIDVIAGTSMGSAIGAMVAMDHAEHDLLVTAVGQAFHKVLDYTLPLSALVTGKRIAEAVEGQFDDRDIADLPIPLVVVSTDLTRSRLAVHHRGDARRVIRASVAIPGVIPPVVIDDALHVDGGVLDNLPIEVLREEVRTGTVIAVDVAPPTGPRAPDDYGTAVSGWAQLWDRLVPGRRPTKVPSLSTTAMRSLLAAATRERDAAIAAGTADLYLQLGRLPCGLLEFDALARVAPAGYEAALEPLTTFLREHPSGRPSDGAPASSPVP